MHASISTLQKLAVFYDTTVLAFFGSSTKPGKLVRPAERKRLSNEPGICIELLAHGKHRNGATSVPPCPGHIER